MSRDYTREILIQKYGSCKSAQAPAVLANEQQPQDVDKASGEFPAIAEYQSISEWLKALVAATKGWPDGIREAVVAEQLNKHRRTIK